LDRRLGMPKNWSGWHGEEKILYPTSTQTPTPSVIQLVASRYTDCTILVPATENMFREVIKWASQVILSNTTLF
jgi:hypothetical protein